MTDELQALLPCPFCGGDAVVYEAFPASEYPWHVAIEHDPDCPDLLWSGVCYATEAEAIAAWNRRTERPALIAEREALREALNRQGDNMAFLLNNVGVPQPWYDKFTAELAEDRATLAGQP